MQKLTKYITTSSYVIEFLLGLTVIVLGLLWGAVLVINLLGRMY